MPLAPERLTGWLSPKWLVTGVALVSVALLANYDLRLAAAAGSLIAVVTALWLYLALRYGSLSGAPSVRGALVERARVQLANRRRAAQGSGAQQRPDPAQRP